MRLLKRRSVETLEEMIRQYSHEGELYEQLEDGKVRCYACGHQCVISNGSTGICRMRYNDGGKLMVPWGYVAGLHVDPIEKKPFFHAYPGSKALSFGMLGCSFHCPYCQNWVTSQALRDPVAGTPIEAMSIDDITRIGQHYRCRVVTSTYNEPFITTEWAVAIFKEAKQYGMASSYVSNGYGNPRVLEYLRPHLDLLKIDLKSINPDNYRVLGGKLERVLETIRLAWEMGMWVEIVTLIVPGFNNSTEELQQLAEFIVSLSPDIPWHVTAFHQNYKMTDTRNTTVDDLLRAAQIGEKAGLRYVYAGNLPGMVDKYENTYCHNCRALLIERYGFHVLQYKLDKGRCYNCGTPIPGRWD
ncbi:MAG TPA: AmmeMemoRadiSam system radical SAM enzyme [Armatimonadetes bacterium]|nr:AmmeMemoRadiSam system radical SAM enzyme [Armatimonadota bacterium]